MKLKQVLEAADRAAGQVASWPNWKQKLSTVTKGGVMQPEDLLPQGGLEYDEAVRIAAVIEAAKAWREVYLERSTEIERKVAERRLNETIEMLQAAAPPSDSD